MPTKKPRVTFTLTQEELDRIDDFRFAAKMKNQTQAILKLIELGLAEMGAVDSSPETKKAPSMTDEAKELLELYNELNPEGQRQVTDYADTLVKSGKYPRAARGKKVV